MSEISDRISLMIKTLGIKKMDLAHELNVTPTFVSMLCSGKQNPGKRTISDICRIYSISEDWLRDGTGEMFAERSRTQEISIFMGKVLAAEPDDIRTRLISALSQLSEDEWKLVESMAQKLAKEFGDSKKADP